MRSVVILACAVWALLLGTEQGHADKRVALVIGNSNYRQVGKLQNPANDATAIAALLERSGFEVGAARLELGLAEMRRAISDFSDTARDADIAVVYFAGHGIEVGGTNFLIPTDATLARDFDVEDEAISLDRVLKAIEPAHRLRLVILDACRNSLFQSTKRGAREIGRGLARVDPSPDTLVAFAAKAGSVASDGSGPNSPFTAALLKHLATPGLDIRLALGQVRDTVLATTSPRQEPFVYGSLGGGLISLVDAPHGNVTSGSVVSPQGATAQCTEAVQSWRDIKDTSKIEELEAFIRRYSDCFYTDLAKLRIAELRKQQQAVLVAPVTPPIKPSPGPNCGHPHGDFVTVGVRWADTDNGLLIRAAPSNGAEIKGVIPPDATGLGASNCQRGWCQVEYACQSGWASERYLSARSNELYRVTGVSPNDPEGLNVRTGPGASFGAQASIPYDARDLIKHTCQPSPHDGSSLWCLVTYRDSYGHDISGWVANRFLTR